VSARAFTVAVFLLALLAGCNARVPTAPPDAPPISVLSLCDNIAMADGWWAAELSQRFGPDVLVVSVHGTTRRGEWWLLPDDDKAVPLHAETVAQTLKLLYPDRPVVFIACNEGGHSLRVAGVWYAKKIVWTKPGADLRWLWFRWEDGAGDVNDFREGGPTTRPVH
jgi:hypothetical protein